MLLWPSALMLRDQLTHLRYEVVRNVHDRFGRFNSSFVLRERFVLGLFFVMGEYAANPLLTPSLWKLALAHWCFFFLRFRYAARGLPVNSQAVMTKTLSGSGSGTYTTRRYLPEAVWPKAILDPSRPARSSPGLSNTSMTSSSFT